MKNLKKPGTVISASLINSFSSFLILSKTTSTKVKALLLLVLLVTISTACHEELENPVPVAGVVTAQAGSDQFVQVNQPATLDASGSKDSQGETITYSWAILTKPTGSNANLNNATQVNPNLIPDVPGEYQLELSVTSVNGQGKARVKVFASETNPQPNAPSILNGPILTDRILTDKFPEPDKADYIVTSTIEVQARLTVAPGVVIEFEMDKGLEVVGQGSLIAKGNGNQPITFTGKQKTPGFWKGIFVGNQAELDYVNVAYGGSSNQRELGVKTNLGLNGDFISGAMLKVTNSSFKNAQGYGMVVMGYLSGFAYNTFRDNSSLPLYIRASEIHHLDENSQFFSLVNPKSIGIAGIIPAYLTNIIWPTFKDGTKYVATGDLTVEGNVKIAPGVTIEFMRGVGLFVRGMGSLVAIGSTTEKITFTGWSKTKGYWKGIVINTLNQTSEFNHTGVSYGGETAFTIGDKSYKGNILLFGDAGTPGVEGALKLTNSTVGHSGGYGMVVAPGGGHITEFGNNIFTNNTSAALFVEPNQIHRLGTDSRFNYNNGYNGIATAGTLLTGHEVTWAGANATLQIHVLEDLIVKSGLKIISSPRSWVQLEFAANKALKVQNNGYLNAKGTPEAHVTFTGYTDPQRAEQWRGITFESSNTLNELYHASVSRGGLTASAATTPGANVTVRGSAKITDCDIFQSNGWGIIVTRSGNINSDAGTANWFENNLQGNYLQE